MGNAIFFVGLFSFSGCFFGAERASELSRRGSLSSRTLSSRVGSINEMRDPSQRRGMILPFEPLSITFDEIRYAVDMPQVTCAARKVFFYIVIFTL